MNIRGGKNMKKKLLGIFVITLLISTAVLPVAGTMNVIKNKTVSTKQITQTEEIQKDTSDLLLDYYIKNKFLIDECQSYNTLNFIYLL